MPDVFRSIPVLQEHLKHNNVMVRDPWGGAVKFVRVLVALFGQGSAFVNFERWSAFLEAAPRRLLWLLWTMYVDDGQITDAQAAKGTGQELAHVFFEKIGAGLKEGKRVWMCMQSLFLGVEHDFTELPSSRSVPFWPREGITAEIEKMMDDFSSTEQCPPGSAAKFRGLNGFAAQAEYGQLGRAPMQPFKQRQCSDLPPWGLSDTMRRAMEFIRMLLKVKPRREVPVVPDERASVVVASDAQVEPGSYPGSGVLIEDAEYGTKCAGYLEFGDETLAQWGLTFQALQEGKQPIALCEAAMVPLALLEWPEAFRGRDVVRYVDNTSAMCSFVKGASANEHLEKMVGLTWILAFHLRCRFRFEWVDSGSNWSDDLSRDLGQDKLSRNLGFQPRPIEQDTTWWSQPWLELWYEAARLMKDRALED